MKHRAKNLSNTRKILNNVHTHACMHHHHHHTHIILLAMSGGLTLFFMWHCSRCSVIQFVFSFPWSSRFHSLPVQLAENVYLNQQKAVCIYVLAVFFFLFPPPPPFCDFPPPHSLCFVLLFFFFPYRPTCTHTSIVLTVCAKSGVCIACTLVAVGQSGNAAEVLYWSRKILWVGHWLHKRKEENWGTVTFTGINKF